MRGAFEDQGGLFSYIMPEARIPTNHPLRKIREIVREVLGELNRSFGKRLRERGTALDPSGAIAERIAAAGVLRHPVGTTTHGAVGLQSFVPLVRGACARRTCLGPHYLHEEPRAAAERRGVYEVHEQPSEPLAGKAAVVGRAFFGGRNANRGLGFTKELSPQGRQRRRRRCELPWTEAQERYTCEYQRPRQPSLPQGRRTGG